MHVSIVWQNIADTALYVQLKLLSLEMYIEGKLTYTQLLLGSNRECHACIVEVQGILKQSTIDMLVLLQ